MVGLTCCFSTEDRCVLYSIDCSECIFRLEYYDRKVVLTEWDRRAV
jgi:hypothetical protein